MDPVEKFLWCVLGIIVVMAASIAGFMIGLWILGIVTGSI